MPNPAPLTTLVLKTITYDSYLPHFVQKEEKELFKLIGKFGGISVYEAIKGMWEFRTIDQHIREIYLDVRQAVLYPKMQTAQVDQWLEESLQRRGTRKQTTNEVYQFILSKPKLVKFETFPAREFYGNVSKVWQKCAAINYLEHGKCAEQKLNVRMLLRSIKDYTALDSRHYKYALSNQHVSNVQFALINFIRRTCDYLLLSATERPKFIFDQEQLAYLDWVSGLGDFVAVGNLKLSGAKKS